MFLARGAARQKEIPVALDLSFTPDWRLFGFAAAATLLTGLAFGSVSGLIVLVVAVGTLVPARRAASVDPVEALRSE